MPKRVIDCINVNKYNLSPDRNTLGGLVVVTKNLVFFFHPSLVLEKQMVSIADDICIRFV